MFQNFIHFEDLCETNNRWVPLADRTTMANCMEAALVCLNALHVEAMAANRFFWHIIPKCHMATHMVYDFAATGVNPRRTTCYADEDMVGRIKKIMSKCHGNSAGRMGLRRYAILVGTRWWKRLAQLRGIRQ